MRSARGGTAGFVTRKRTTEAHCVWEGPLPLGAGAGARATGVRLRVVQLVQRSQGALWTASLDVLRAWAHLHSVYMVNDAPGWYNMV